MTSWDQIPHIYPFLEFYMKCPPPLYVFLSLSVYLFLACDELSQKVVSLIAGCCKSWSLLWDYMGGIKRVTPHPGICSIPERDDLSSAMEHINQARTFWNPLKWVYMCYRLWIMTCCWWCEMMDLHNLSLCNIVLSSCLQIPCRVYWFSCYLFSKVIIWKQAWFLLI